MFSNDAHDPSDPELRVWGEHAMPAARALASSPSWSRDRTRARSSRPSAPTGAFDGTGLDEHLRALGVEEVAICGRHAYICVRHSAYGALIRGYRVTIRRDACVRSRGSTRRRRWTIWSWPTARSGTSRR